MSSSAPTLVLVHGAWGGGWVWRRVLAPLRDAGFEVHTVTLTGDGERAHLRRPDIDLHTHIADVIGLVEMEELENVVLVGHSYGGMVITGAAVELQQRHPGVLSGLVYVDAMFPRPGDGWGVAHSPEVASARRHVGGDLAQLRAALSQRQAELVALVRELYKLAAAEKDSGAVCFAARSRLFNQSAAIYRSLGPEAFAEEQDADAENAPPA